MATDSASPGILLATDLEARCDRATDRAIRLARAFGGGAVAASMVEPAQLRAQEVPMYQAPPWYRERSPLQHARQRLEREFAAETVPWEVRVGEGGAGEAIAAMLDAGGGGQLVVTGPVRPGLIGPAVLGSTVDRLLRRAGTSLLVVRERVHDDYRRVLFTTDFSAPCRTALERARAWFPQARISVLHGFQVPMLGLLDSSQAEAVAAAAAQAREEGRAFLREAGLDEGVPLLVEHGDPVRLAQQYLETHGTDLVVLGTHGRGAVYELVVGSVARRMLTTLEADTLVVRA